MDGPDAGEFGFELGLCARIEEATDWLPARQLGGAVAAPGRRVVDIVGVVPGDSFDRRAAITDRTIPPPAVEGAAGPGEAVPRSEAVDVHPRRRAAVVDRAVEVGFLERVRRSGRTLVRTTTRYPGDWFAELVAVENKPDLGRPGDLGRQLRHDVALALFDRVVLATRSRVTRAHRNRLPDAVGIWRVDPEEGWTVVRPPDRLATDETGVEPVETTPARTDVALVPPGRKRRARRRVAERAYGKGWRTYDLPACAHATTTRAGRPWCTEFDAPVDPRTDCGTACPARAPADPPSFDPETVRDRRTSWRAEPPGVADRQAGLDRLS